MPLIYALGGLLLNLAGSMVGRVLLALGLSYVTYTGFDTAISWLLNQVKGNLSALPADVLSFLGWLWVDKAIGMMFSTYAACMTVKLAGGSVLTKLVRK
jgi:integral membrane sensor domain MASE1